MNSKGYGKFLTILLIISIIVIVGLLCFGGYRIYKKSTINKQTSAGIESFISEIQDDNNIQENNITEETNIEGLLNDIDSTQINNNTISNEKKTTKKYYYKNYQMIGYIEIEKTNIKYPILSRATISALEEAVAVLYPEEATLNESKNVVIAGHNYKNGLFFSNNKKLVIGDKIYITDTKNIKQTYTIYKIFETTADDTSFYTRDTEGKAEITLSTCADSGGNKRLIILASV